ncbi:MAG TPA: acyltransferase family protein [Marmoricola sp.]|nr:acyltransferase family protein [Marmoricola sp.]
MTTLRSRDVVERAPSPAATVAPTPTKPARDPWFDNVKMTLVTLVVVGHSWTLLPHNTTNHWSYTFLYAWHIPAFAIITGYLSRSFAWTPARMWALVRTVAVPYVIFEAALAWFRYQVGGVALDDLFADPHWPMWYLSALFFWRLITPVFTSLARPVALGLAVVISLLAGLRAGDTLDMARILGLLPFFVLGLILSEREWGWLRSRRAAVLALLGVATVLAFTRLTDSWIATEWYYYRSRYDVLEPNDLRAASIRALLLLVGLVGAASCFALVPRGKSWFSTLGAATLVVYLFHGFFVLSAQYEGFPDWADRHVVWSRVVTTGGAVVLALLLATPLVARVLQVAVDPIGWLGARRRALLPQGGRLSRTVS